MKTGRNDPCPCGSGKKFKHCCLAKSLARTESPAELTWRRMQRANEGLIPRMMRFVVETYGEDAIDEAWDEFILWDEDVYTDWYDSPHQSVFLPWLLHRWSPDPHDDTSVLDEKLHGVPPTRAFLDRHARHLEPATQRYLEACLEAPFTFYEILDYQRDHHFVARELISGTEHVVLERSASQNMLKGYCLYGSVVCVDDIAMLEACGTAVIPPIHKLPVIEAREKILTASEPVLEGELAEWDIELRTLYLSISEQILNPAMPEIRNTDGDELLLQRLVFDIDSPQETFDALKHLARDASDDDLLALAERGEDGSLRYVQFQWVKRGNRQHKGWETTSLGMIEIDQHRLNVYVNSRERAAVFKHIVETALGSRARFRVAEIESAQRAFEAEEAGDDWEVSQRQLADLPEIQAAIREMMIKHYDGWLNEKLPALKGRTPLEAVKQRDGRERVEALVAQIEADGHRMEPPLDDAIPRRLREKLGLQA